MQAPSIAKSPLLVRATRIIRWLLCMPAAWETWHVHDWILQALGVSISKYAVAISDQDMLAWCIAGLMTPACVITVGTWICPVHNKQWPALFFGTFCICAGVGNLRQAMPLTRFTLPLGLNGILIILMSAAMFAVWAWMSQRRRISV